MVRNFNVQAVHKYMYPATYNFRDDEDGAEPTGWTSDNGAGCTTTIIASLDGHRKVLDCLDGNPATTFLIEKTLTAATVIYFEFWVRFTALTTTYFSVFDAVPVQNYWRLDTIAGMVINTWHHIKFLIDTTADTYNLWRDNSVIAAGAALPIAVMGDVVKIRFNSTAAATGFHFYVDAVGLFNDTSYKVGDNCFWRHYGESTDSFEGDDVGTQGTSKTNQ